MDITEVFLKFALQRQEFQEAIDLVKANSEGNAWLIGGYVCRGIIQELYGVPIGDYDFDFFVEGAREIRVPDGWEQRINSYGNPKLIGPHYEIDYVPLKSIHSIVRRGLEPTIDNFLTGAPLTIQSIAYDIDNQKVIGEAGILAIKNREVGINNLEQAKHRAAKKGVILEELVAGVAAQFNFRPVLE